MIQLSAVIITFNEERNIERCLKSLQLVADEIIVVDSFSTDKTKEICAQFNTTFITHPFKGHIQQKNYALDQAKYPYVLSLDADEALSKELTESILEVKKNWQFPAYRMNRLTNYCGNWIKHGSWYPDSKVRLAIKNEVFWGGDNPHDKLLLKSTESIGSLQGDLLHYSYYSIKEHYQQQDRFSTIAAQALFEKGKKAPWYKLFLNPMASWIKDIIIRSGYLDGKSGFTVAKISALSVFWKYKKLRDLWKKY